MQIHIDSSDVSLAALQGINLPRFLRHVETLDSTEFSEVFIKTCFGLVIFVFPHRSGDVTCAVGFKLLEITSDYVISDRGEPVDRYVKIVEELHKTAQGKLKLPQAEKELKRRSGLITVKR